MNENTINEAALGTTPTEGEIVENALDDGGDGTEPKESEATAKKSAENTPPAPFLSVKYNHEEKGLTEDEARDFAQKGMFYHSKLDYIAALKGTTANELVEKMISDIDEDKRVELIERFGDDEDTINDMMRLFHEKNREKYAAALEGREAAEKEKAASRNAQIADEFLELQKDFPELTGISDIPDAVLKAAENMPLGFAYLLHKHRENTKITAARVSQATANEASGGNLSTAESDNKTTAEQAFLKALWGNR